MKKEKEQRKVEIIKPIEWSVDKVVLIDQTKLPTELVYEAIVDYRELIVAIKELKVRGAPAIGIAGAYGFVLGVNPLETEDVNEFINLSTKIGEEIVASRPTAVNLSWAVNRLKKIIKDNKKKSVKKIKDLLLEESFKIHEEDLSMCQQIGENGNALIKDGMKILTHCNAGALATGGYGTALAIIYKAFESGKNIEVYADETRPLLQGSRLTAWELKKAGIDVTVISDNMAAWTMKKKQIDCVIVGADRIAENGDTANKIGTYGLSILAKEHNVPFYVAAPTSTLDLNLADGTGIPIEERGSEEIIRIGTTQIAPENVRTFTPAFDVTPAENINAIITEKKTFFYPYKFKDMI